MFVMIMYMLIIPYYITLWKRLCVPLFYECIFLRMVDPWSTQPPIVSFFLSPYTLDASFSGASTSFSFPSTIYLLRISFVVVMMVIVWRSPDVALARPEMIFSASWYIYYLPFFWIHGAIWLVSWLFWRGLGFPEVLVGDGEVYFEVFLYFFLWGFSPQSFVLIIQYECLGH